MTTWLRNPWGRPRVLVLVTGIYIAWSILPVAIAILFAFNNGRSRTAWQGFSLRWFTGATGSVFHDSALQGALEHTLILAVICVAVSVPLGVTLALGLQRWRGRGGGTINTVMLLPLVTPEIVMGVALLLLFLRVFPGIGLGTPAQAIGQITFTISYVVVMVRGRLGLDRAGVRGGGGRSRRAAARPAPAGAAAAAGAGDHRQRRGRVRALARRLRRDAVPLEQRKHDDGLDASLRERTRCSDAGPERDRDGRRWCSRWPRSRSPSSSTAASPAAARRPPSRPSRSDMQGESRACRS